MKPLRIKQWWTYDIECYVNFFLIAFEHVDSGDRLSFEISPYRNDLEKMVSFFKQCMSRDAVWVGYNNLWYDFPLLDYGIRILPQVKSPKEWCNALKQRSDALIRAENPYFEQVKEPFVRQIDPFRINHFENVSRRVSLKELEFTFRMDNIQELPYHHTSWIEEHMAVNLRAYCWNDVTATRRLLDKTMDEIELRFHLSTEYGMDMTNFNSPKMGEKIVSSIVRQTTNKYDLGKTYREAVNLGKIIFDYVSFSDPALSAVHSWLSKKIITSTKAVFTEIPFDELTELEGYYVVKRKKGKQENLNVLFADIKWVFGVGGIHASVEGEVIRSNDEWMIWDIDVASYYPNIGIANELYPEHLGRIFCSIYEQIYEERKKHAKGSVMNKALKLALNAVFGKSNSEHSDMYDWLYTMSITVNGQLMLCMLAEWLTTIEGLRILQANTDGMTVLLKREDILYARHLCSKWESMTKLTLEYAEYKMMAIKDVNNYMAVDTTDEIKAKGAFLYNRELYQNHSMLIVPLALQAYFHEGIPPEIFVMKHRDVYDFFKRTKVPRNMRLVLREYTPDSRAFTIKVDGKPRRWEIDCVHAEDEAQRVMRYYVSRQGKTLIKIMPPLPKKPGILRESNLEKSYLVTDASDLKDRDLDAIRRNIDYSYYIAEVRKVIEKTEHG